MTRIEEPAARDRARHVAGDCRGENFYRFDSALRRLLPLYVEADLFAHLEPHLDRLGELAGGRLDELAEAADKHPPLLHARDRFGRDEEWIEYHPAYREMERIAFAELGLHAMSHRGGVLGWPEPFPAPAKYAFQYLFTQAEFGLMCPISVTDTSAHLVRQFADDELRARLLPRMLSQDLDELWKGTQFMTERAGGSDVGAIESVAVHQHAGVWRLHGEKWFCSHADAEVALLLARPEGAPDGTAGLGLFAMPRTLDDGSRNRYRITRLKDKLGTRSMASGEILLEGAEAWLVGDAHRGFKQMMEQVNLSRLSHGVRAAAMMRRCLNEARIVAHQRTAFRQRLDEMPLVRRELGKLLLPSEEALSMSLFAASLVEAARGGDSEAAAALRLVTPLLKYRACRDNLQVATGSMEVRGGNGYVEDWINARLVRDAQIGVIWEGTSNINALDAIVRAVGKERSHESLRARLAALLDEADTLPAAFRTELEQSLERAVRFALEVAEQDDLESQARRAAAALYHAAAAIVLAWEGERLATAGGDGRRTLVARLVLDHRLRPRDPLAATPTSPAVLDLLLAPAPVSRAQVAELV